MMAFNQQSESNISQSPKRYHPSEMPEIMQPSRPKRYGDALQSYNNAEFLKARAAAAKIGQGRNMRKNLQLTEMQPLG